MRGAALGRQAATSSPPAATAPKRAWYGAEQSLRNQIDRTYEAQMDWTLEDLERGNPAIGKPAPPDTDARAYLVAQTARPGAEQPAKENGRPLDGRFNSL